MKIKDFPDLLARALRGEMKALTEWDYYHSARSFKGKDIIQAFDAIEAILSQENHVQRSHALFLAAFMYEKGLGGVVNHAASIQFYKEAIELGNPSAMNNLAYMYERGLGGPADHLEVDNLYERAIELGHPSAMTNLAYRYQCHLVEYHALPGFHEQIAALSDTKAMARLYDLSIRKAYRADHLKAIDLLERAIALGDAAAMNSRACMLEDKGDVPRAIKLLERAIQLGNAAAMNSRACMCIKEGNIRHAKDLFRLAIRWGDATAMYNLAGIYQQQGNYPKAIKYYETAIALDNPSAMYKRATMHQYGQGGPVNYPEAIRLYARAAKLHHPEANKVNLDALKIFHDNTKDRITFFKSSNSLSISASPDTYAVRSGLSTGRVASRF